MKRKNRKTCGRNIAFLQKMHFLSNNLVSCLSFIEFLANKLAQYITKKDLFFSLGELI